MKTLESSIFGGGLPDAGMGAPPKPMPAAAASYLTEVKQNADGAWAIPLRKVSEDPGGLLRWVGAGAGEEAKAYNTVISGVRMAYKDAAERMMSAPSKAQYDAAAADMKSLLANPGSEENIRNLTTKGFIVSDVERRKAGYGSFMPTEAARGTIGRLLKDGGTRWLPAGIGADAASIASLVPSYGTVGNEVFNWVPTDQAPKEYKSVAQMVLAEREKNWKPLPQILQELAAPGRGWITQSNVTRQPGSPAIAGGSSGGQPVSQTVIPPIRTVGSAGIPPPGG
jgi:hypothetical protein